MSTPAKPYKETLNLPKTRFAMKANLTTREPQIQARWAEEDLYGQIRQARAGRERRVLHDGPPYANGDIHMGHLLNKVLKDVVVRSLTMRGFDSPYVPGWDCHGLPIEHKVMKDLGSKAASLSAAEIREKCRVEALKWVDIQRNQFRRLGIEGSWDDPYLTLKPGFEASILDVLADLVEAGYVFRQLKPIHWCMTDRTALAEAELEYSDETSPSLYVNFPMVSGVPESWGDGPWHAMIWTTTPWTLPANVAIAAHPDVIYAGVRYQDPQTGQVIQTILAADLVERVMGLRKVAEFSEVGRVRGCELEHSQYRHAFLDRHSPVVLADYVTVEDGTGLVHTAPGHGAEDYRTGQKYDLPTLSPVDAAGRFNDEAPEFVRGEKVFQANPKIVEKLREVGALYHAFDFSHSYPHCWRCKNPVIFRATAQWFVGVDHSDLRGRALKVINEDVRWLPGWGQSRIEAMVANRPDWCISRQRHWGVPIPAFSCTTCDEKLLTAESVRHVRDLFRREGADAWYTKDVADLLPIGASCPACGGQSFEKTHDILDVWFESGSSHRGVLAQNFELGYPAFMYLEGSDQHRGWFMSSLLNGVATMGQAPFETVLTHGFVVDEQGRKMSKSLGNVIPAVATTEQYGADVLRLYVASLDYADDVRMSVRGIKEASEAYRKIRNTFRYLLGNLDDYAAFDPESVDPSTLHEIDRWALGQLNKVIRDVTAAYERFEFYRVYQRIYQFCAVDLSSFYLDVLKDRLYAELPDGPDRRAAQFVLARLHDALIRLLAPILPHTAEELWEFLPDRGDKPASVHMAEFPEAEDRWDDSERDLRWEILREVRGASNTILEKRRREGQLASSQEGLVELYTDRNELLTVLNRYQDVGPHKDDLATIFIVSEVKVIQAPEIETVQDEFGWTAGEKQLYDPALRLVARASKTTYQRCDRCWRHRPTVVGEPRLCDRCKAVMAESASA